MANDVTEQVRDKLIDIIIAVLARECEDFDGESVRRLIVTELATTPLTFALEKRASAAKTKTLKEPKEPKTKTKVVELDADGNPIKKVRTPKEPKEKAPKAPKAVLTEEEREARKAAKQAEKDAEKEARKAAKQAEKEAAKEARKAAKETEKDADKEAAKAAAKAEKEAEKAAKLAEREVAKAARKAEKDAEREAAKVAKQAEKEAAPVVAKEQRLPIPWCGVRIPNRCEALRVYHGLFAQCTGDSTEISAFCNSCQKSGAKFGTCSMRAACGLFDYTDPSGKKCTRLANVVEKFGFTTTEAFQVEAAKHDITIPYEHLEKEVKQRGRPKSASPRASKVATSDTGSGSETETDDEEHQQKRKQVTKAAGAEAPKKRGRPAKNPKSDVTPSDEMIQDLVASAAAMSVASTPSTPVAAPKPSAETPAAPKKVTKSIALRKPAQRKTRTIEEQVFWVDTFNGAEILIRQEDNATFEASSGNPLGFWDDATKTITACDEEDEE
jgi:chemotaxis protein histidine kinase CheA